MSGLPAGIEVLVRGWLHGNCVMLAGERPALVDTGYHTGVSALLAACEAHFQQPIGCLQEVVLTHVHSDHAGGTAALQALCAARVRCHPAAAALVRSWDTRGLWLDATGQELPPFRIDACLDPGTLLRLGNHDWRVVDTPGHATGGISLYCAAERVLLSADALWEQGFGMLDPDVDGPQVFDQAQMALDNLAALEVRCVVPGHGPPFSDFAGALARARSRLQYWRAHPERVRHHAVRNGLLFFRLLHPQATEAALHTRLTALARTHSSSPDGCAGLMAAVQKALQGES